MKNLHCQHILALMAVYAALHPAGWGQTRINLSQQARTVDFSGASFTKSFRTGESLPAVCSTGETFMLITASAGNNFYACTATNTWSPQGGGAPSAAGQIGKVLSSDGVVPVWRAAGGDVVGSPEDLRVLGLRGRQVSDQAPLDGDVLKWNEHEGRWMPEADSDNLAAGYGVLVTGATIAVDDALVPRYFIGSGGPSLSCAPGRDSYVDSSTQEIYVCTAANVWSRLLKASGVSTADLTAGTLPLVRGGTNHTTWIAGRCVQVSADGTRLESAATGCGSGGGDGGIWSASWTGATVSPNSTAYADFARDGVVTVEAARQQIVPARTLFSNFCIDHGAQPADGSLTLTVRRNGVDTALAVSIPAGAQAGVKCNETDLVTFSDGAKDRITVKLQNFSGSASAPLWSAGVKHLVQ